MDRLAELKGDDVDLEAGGGTDGGDEQYMTDFFEDVGQIKAWMSSIRKNVGAIEEVYGQYITAVSADQTKESSAELDELLDETSGLTKKVSEALKQMDADNKAAAGSSEARIRTNMHNTLTAKFLDLITSYQEAQRKYKDKHSEKMRRQILIVNPDASEKEIQEAMSSGSKDIFAGQLLDSPYKKEAEEALNYVQNKHKEIQKLERSINELHQLFVDMAVLVEAQGELINQIENNVSSATAHTEKGVQQLKKANEYQKKSRKKMCLILICMSVLLLVILIPTLTSVLGDDQQTVG